MPVPVSTAEALKLFDFVVDKLPKSKMFYLGYEKDPKYPKDKSFGWRSIYDPQQLMDMNMFTEASARHKGWPNEMCVTMNPEKNIGDRSCVSHKKASVVCVVDPLREFLN